MSSEFDCVIPFHLEKSNIRGRLVRLDEILRDILEQHNYPALVNFYVAEATSLALAIVSSFKFDGLFTLQITGEGALRLLVVDINKEGHIRACARFDEAQISTIPEENRKNIQHVFGKGYFAFTIEPEKDDRYQGIVELTGTTLADSTHHFFRQSEQLETGVILATSNNGNFESTLYGAALMIQRMPFPTNVPIEEKERLDDEWIHAVSLVGSMTKKELLNRNLANQDILYRLFWENGVRVHASRSYVSKCRCSREKIHIMLKSFNPDEIKQMVVDSKISVTCEFCNRHYDFTEEEL